MAQKLTFLTEDLAVSDAPDQAVLEQFHIDNRDNYTEPQRFSFQHRYFSADRRDDAQQVAERALTDAALAGDPFMLQKQYAQRSQREVGDLFGREFAAVSRLLLPTNNGRDHFVRLMAGMVRLTKVLPSRMLNFNEVQNRVLADWQQAQRKQANADYYRALSERYDVRLPGPADPTS